MSNCPHYSNGVCTIACHLTGYNDVSTTAEACLHCSSDKDNPQSVNKVTCSISLTYLKRNGKYESRHKGLFTCVQEPEIVFGPGTELDKLIGWLASSDCQCNARKAQMNAWGVTGCLQNVNTIMGWLTEEADKRKLIARRIPGFRLAVYLLIRYSIWRAYVRQGFCNQPPVS